MRIGWHFQVSLFGLSLASVVVLLGVTEAGAQAPPQEQEISPNASRQIQELLEEKATRTPAQRKISSDLQAGLLERELTV